MKLSQFNFSLPETHLAQYPYHYRDDSRMMVLHRTTGEIEHRYFKDILDYFDEHDLFVFNNTRVLPARLYGNKEKTGARIEVFLQQELNPAQNLWGVLVDPARKIRIGNKLYFGPDDSVVAEVIDNTTSRGRTLRFLFDGPNDEFRQMLFALGEAPLPRKIFKRDSEEEDLERFQSVFATEEGAVTAPSASLHFSREMMKKLEIKGIDLAFLTLHCGTSNFNDSDVDDLTKHKIDSEPMRILEDCCTKVNAARDAGRKIVAVGTTVQRALETAADTQHHIRPYEGMTNRFIFPPYNFQIAHAMVAGFYLPKSTLLMLTAAFGGYERVMKAYEVAIECDYKFGPYGDALLIID